MVEMMQLRVGAGFMILVGLFLAETYGWAAGANLIEQGLAIVLMIRLFG